MQPITNIRRLPQAESASGDDRVLVYCPERGRTVTAPLAAVQAGIAQSVEWAAVKNPPATATRWPSVAEVDGLTAALGDKLDATNRYTDAEAVAAIQAAPEWHATNWDAAYGWGDHSLAGYLKSVSWGDVDDKPAFGPAATADTVGSGKVLRQGAAKADVLSNQPDYYKFSGSREIDLDQVSWGDCILAASSKVLTAEPIPFESKFYYIETQRQYASSAIVQMVWEYQGNRFAWRSIRAGYTPPPWAMEYTDQNTTVDPSGFVRASGSAEALTKDDAGSFATAAQGAKADSAVQPGDIGTAAAEDASAFDPAGSAQSAQDYAVQRANHTGTQPLSTISDAGTAAATDATDYDPAGSAARAEARVRDTIRRTPDPLLMMMLS